MTLHRSSAAGVVLLTALTIAGCAASPQASSPLIGSSPPAALASVLPSSSTAAGSTAVPTPVAVLPGEPWIAYLTFVGGGAVTYLMRPDGTDAHQFAINGEVKGKHPDWSPDGQRIALDVGDDMWVVDADGSHPEQLTSDGCCDYPAWSPDGTKVAFAGYSSESLGTKPISSWIRVLDLATRQETTVIRTQRPRLVDVPRWSPDGKELVVGVHQMDREGFETGAAIAIVPAAGGKLRYLTKFDAFAFYPDWSWATNMIVLDTETIVDKKAPGPGDKTSNLYIIQPDGTGLTQITDVAKGTRIIQPTWAPDGKSIFADFADVWLGVRVDPVTGAVDNFAGCCVSHPRLRPTP